MFENPYASRSLSTKLEFARRLTALCVTLFCLGSALNFAFLSRRRDDFIVHEAMIGLGVIIVWLVVLQRLERRHNKRRAKVLAQQSLKQFHAWSSVLVEYPSADAPLPNQAGF